MNYSIESYQSILYNVVSFKGWKNTYLIE